MCQADFQYTPVDSIVTCVRYLVREQPLLQPQQFPRARRNTSILSPPPLVDTLTPAWRSR